jgi:hypothetical protein
MLHQDYVGRLGDDDRRPNGKGRPFLPFRHTYHARPSPANGVFLACVKGVGAVLATATVVVVNVLALVIMIRVVNIYVLAWDPFAMISNFICIAIRPPGG